MVIINTILMVIINTIDITKRKRLVDWMDGWQWSFRKCPV